MSETPSDWFTTTRRRSHQKHPHDLKNNRHFILAFEQHSTTANARVSHHASPLVSAKTAVSLPPASNGLYQMPRGYKSKCPMQRPVKQNGGGLAATQACCAKLDCISIAPCECGCPWLALWSQAHL